MRKISLIFFILLFCRSFSQNNPSVEFTVIPEWGQADLLQGKVHNTTISDHGVAVYIFLEEVGGWWTKPSFAQPVTLIQQDSAFTTNIVTGGIDQYATRIIAFLIPLSISPPLIPGGELPDTMFNYPYAVNCRPHGDRIISWSGFDWVVKRSVADPPLPMGPGPNIFNDNDTMVWVDALHRLHLRISKKGNAWHCSEVICTSSLGLGLYEFNVGSRVDLLDPRIINGIFTWDDCSPFAQPPNNFFREIDIEFSRWGDPFNENSQYVIQPYYILENINRFNMDLTGHDHSLHSFEWRSDSIVFSSIWGASSYSWKYVNSEYIPIPGTENVRINLWLMNGWSPLDNLNAEVIFNSVVTDLSGERVFDKNVKIYPNPTNGGCLIEFLSEGSGYAEISLIDLQGNIIKRIFNGMISPGLNRIEWDGKTESGYSVLPGLYLIHLSDKSENKWFKIVKW